MNNHIDIKTIDAPPIGFTPTPATRLDGIGEYYFSSKLREIESLRKEGKNIINLGIGSPDMPPHASVITELQNTALLPTNHGYQSYKGSPVLRNAIKGWYDKWYGVHLDPDTEILPLIGSKEGIMHICMAYLGKGDKALLPNPGYPTYRSAVMLAGGECEDYDVLEENGYAPDFDALEKQGLNNAKIIFVNYPHMPTGKAANLELFEKIISFAQKHNLLVVHDNPYSFILNENPLSILQIEGAKERTVELNSLSKSHNMAGWRVGCMTGAPNIITEALRFKSNMDSGMFLPVQLAASKALALGKEWYEEVNKTYRERRLKVYELLNSIPGCSYEDGQVGLFVWASVDNKVYTNGYALSDRLLYNNSIFITPGGIFGSNGNNYIRVSLCNRAEVIEDAIQRVKS